MNIYLRCELGIHCKDDGVAVTKFVRMHHLCIGVDTILPLPILYGVWHATGGSGGIRKLRSRRAIVLQ